MGLASVAAGFVTTLIAGGLVRWMRTWWNWLQRRRRNRVMLLPVLSFATGLVLAGALAAVIARPAEAVASCEHPVELRILTAPSRLMPARELASAYQAETAEANDGCPTVSPYVYAVPSMTALDTLQAGWPPTALRDVGPGPDLWLPESTSQVESVREAVQGADGEFVIGEAEVVGSSPLVLAMAEPAVSDEATAYHQDHTWDELVQVAMDQFEWPLGRPAPAASVVGELAVTALHSGPDAESEARGIEQWIAQALDEGGYPLADTDALLCRHRQREPSEAAGTALLTTEQAMVRFNRGDPLSGPCAAAADPPDDADQPPADRLLAFYPIDTFTIDQPVVTLAWRQPSTPQAQAATDYLRWFASPAGQAELIKTGLRVEGVVLGDEHAPLTPEFGALPEAMPADQIQRPPPAEATERAWEIYQSAQRPGRVLLALDLSGSMADPADGTLTRYEVAQRGVEAALGQLGDQDELGLWVFRDTGWGPPAGFTGALFQRQSRASEAVQALPSLQPDGATPLYRTILAGVQAVGEHEDLVTGLVVLTDGEDTEDDPDTEQALAALDRAAGVRVFVVAIGEASCRVDAIAGVTSRTGGECVQADFDTLDAELARIFGVLWSSDGD